MLSAASEAGLNSAPIKLPIPEILEMSTSILMLIALLCWLYWLGLLTFKCVGLS